MSALNVIREHDRVHVITDGAAIDPQGRLAGLIHKAVPMPHLQAVLALRGPRGAVSFMSEMVSSEIGQSYDDLKRLIADHLRRTLAPAFERDGIRMDIVVAGWSDALGRPDAYMLDSHGQHSADRPAWTVVDVDLALMTPTSEALAAEFNPVISGGSYEIERLAGDIIDRQRRIPSEWGTAGEVPIVGCFAQLTTVTRDGISTKIVRRWLHECEPGSVLGLSPSRLPGLGGQPWGAGPLR